MPTSRPCPQCKAVNSPHARFCINCGKPLSDGQHVTRRPSLPPAAAEPAATPVVQQRVDKALGAVIGVLQGSIGQVNITPAILETGRSPLHQVVPPSAEYLPRRTVEDKLRAALTTARPGRPALVELYGPPGSGKSSVGRKVAVDLEKEFPDARLWVEVDDHSDIHLLWRLIDPFEAPPERSPFRDTAQYRAVLNRALEGKRLLIVFNRVTPASFERVRQALPDKRINYAALVISDAHIPDLADLSDPASAAFPLPELSAEEACHLFRLIWGDAYRSTSDETLAELAAEFHYLPTQIAVIARDIRDHQVSPADYLNDIRLQKSARPMVTAGTSGFQAVFDNLPDLARRALPFIGVMGAGAWQGTALAAVSQLTLDDAETALRQLCRVGFVMRVDDGRCSAGPAARDFALAALNTLGGEALVRSARSLLAYRLLRSAEESTLLRRQSFLKDFFADESGKLRFLEAMRQAFLPDEFGQAHGDTGTLSATPGLGDYDLVQDAFEETALANPLYLARWQGWINSSPCIDQAHHLEDALRQAIEQEDWPLTRQFYNISLGVYVPELTAAGEKTRKGTVMANGFRFGAIRRLHLTDVFFETTLWGVRILRPELTRCELVGAYWGGVRLHRPTLDRVDMVNAMLPGLVIQDGRLADVDFRGADLRGAVFYNCHFNRANFRSADLRQARFLSCGGSDIDLRSARLEGVGFHNCIFSRAVYYKGDAERLPLQSDTTRIEG